MLRRTMLAAVVLALVLVTSVPALAHPTSNCATYDRYLPYSYIFGWQWEGFLGSDRIYPDNADPINLHYYEHWTWDDYEGWLYDGESTRLC